MREYLRRVWRHALKERGRCHVWDRPFTDLDAALAYWEWRKSWRERRE